VGLSLGDPAALSARSTLGALVDLEQRHGSVLRGAVLARAPRRRAWSFREGMGTLTRALSARLGPAVETGVVVDEVRRGHEGRFEIAVTRRDGARETLAADDVVAATPAAVTAALLAPLSGPLSEALRAIPFASAVTCTLAFRAGDFAPAPPRGYGVMVPTGEGMRIRGCLFSTWSTGVPACPGGEVLLRMLLGGRLEPAVVSLPDHEVAALCHRELERPLGLRRAARAMFRRVERIVPGFPQYEVGHDDRLAAIQAHARWLGGVHLVGSSYRGIPVSRVVEDAEQLAASLLGGHAP
jgi:oxygen-dependent protoporphyrinogen oxidase